MTTNGPVTWHALGEISERLARVEEWRTAQSASHATHGTRVWLLVMGLMTAVVFPLVTTALITWLHLRGT